MRSSTEPSFNWWQPYFMFAANCRRALLSCMQQTAEAWVQVLQVPATPLPLAVPAITEQQWLRVWLYWQDCLQQALPGRSRLPDALALSALLAKPAVHSELSDKMLAQLIRLTPPATTMAAAAVSAAPPDKPSARRSRGKSANGQ